MTPAALLAIGAIASATAAGIRLGWHLPLTAKPATRREWGAMTLASAALLTLGISLATPGTTPGGLIALWTVLAVEEVWAWSWFVGGRVGRIALPALRVPRWDWRRKPAPRVERRGAASHHPRPVTVIDGVPPDEVSQQLVRSRVADGAEELSGWLRLAFAAGQRTGSIHVAFCPPFATAPELTIEQSGGPEARIKTAQLLPYGARIDLKLAAAAGEPTSVLLQFTASEKVISSPAAVAPGRIG